MRKPQYLILIFLVLCSKLALAGSNMHVLFETKPGAHIIHHSEVATYCPVFITDQPVEMEEDLLEKTKKQLPFLSFFCGTDFSSRSVSVSRIPSFSGPVTGSVPGDLVILFGRILI